MRKNIPMRRFEIAILHFAITLAVVFTATHVAEANTGLNSISSVQLPEGCVAVCPQGFDAGGWGLDSQFLDTMGSPYLIAHGMGNPVLNARASVAFPTKGRYRVWVRTKNWADGSPGRFRVIVDGRPLDRVFGAGAQTWSWEDGGIVEIIRENAVVELEDITGFDGRCAGIVFMKGDDRPTGALRAEKSVIRETVSVDLVVVGGGIAGTCAAVAAARRGIKVALVQDRPVLGGNNSGEIRVWAGGEMKHPIVKELCGTFMNRNAKLSIDDARRLRIVQDEKNISLHVLTRAFGAEMNEDGSVCRVKALDLRRNCVVAFEAKLFCDATGDGWLGFWAGADWRMGREAKSEFNEAYAPEKADDDTLGASIMWTSAEANRPVAFSAPWAEPHAKGVIAVNGEWNWEYGIHRDMIAEAEEIRDRLLLAVYGSFSLAKRLPKNANRVLDFCPYVLGKRESRRIMGDWILSESDVVKNREFEDSIASGTWSIDLHYAAHKSGADFLSVSHGPRYGRYWIPYRCVYSRNVPNLFMAGRCFSATHVGLGSPRVIGTLGQMGVAVGEAAALCRELGVSPRSLFSDGHVRKLQKRLGGGFPGVPDPLTAGWLIVDDESEGVEFGDGWKKTRTTNGGQVGGWSHFPDMKAGKAIYPLPVGKKGRYVLMGKVPYSWAAKPGSSTVFGLVSDGRVYEFEADQAQGTGEWQKLGEFDLAPGAILQIYPSRSKGFVSADGFALVPIANTAIR